MLPSFHAVILCLYLCLLFRPRRTAGSFRMSDERLEAIGRLNDVTKGLTDSEVESSLDGLSVDDLKALDEFIESSKSLDYEMGEQDSFLDNNIRIGPLVGLESDRNEYEQLDETIEGGVNPSNMGIERHYRHHHQPKGSHQQVYVVADTPRSKRENPVGVEGIPVDEEYIKQLENSFPRDQEQSEHDLNDAKKEHVRVKRF